MNIPARPFMTPGITKVRDKVKETLKSAAQGALQGKDPIVALNRVGLISQASIRNAINDGIPPPLADSTLRGRIRNRTAIKGAKQELANRESGILPGMQDAKPLVATGQLRNSINYVIREK